MEPNPFYCKNLKKYFTVAKFSRNCPNKTSAQWAKIPQSDADVMILKLFSTKNLAQILAFLTQNKAKF
jgi:hypothetical protein